MANWTGTVNSSSFSSLYRQVLASVDPMAVLEHYGAQNMMKSDKNEDEVIHSCLIDRVHPHHTNGDQSPSASMNIKKMLYSCWSYGGGDIVWLVQELEGWTSSDEIENLRNRQRALRKLAEFMQDDFSSETSPLERVRAIMAKGESTTPIPTYSTVILRPWRQIHPYLTQERGLDKATLQRFQIGYDPEEKKITIPHFFNGKLVGFQKRRLDYPWVEFQPDQVPKYKNSTDFPKNSTLYNWDNIKDRGLKSAIVVESVMSVLKAEMWGCDNVLATFGGKVTKEQIELLKEFDEVMLYLDNDPGGWGGTVKLYNGLKGYVKVYIVDAETGVDLGDLNEPEDLLNLLNSAKVGSLVINRYIKKIEEIKGRKT